MATALRSLPVDEIGARARQVRLGRTVALLITGLFWLIGWLAAFCWVSVVFCAISVRYGWRAGFTTAGARILGEQPEPAAATQPGR